MRENRPSGSEGGAGLIPCPYPYPMLRIAGMRIDQCFYPRR
jgi:hypothetical protein